MERNSNKVLLTVIAIAVLIVATVGATFAYFSATGGTQTQNIKTGELRVSATSSIADGVSIKPTTWSSAADAEDDADIAKVGLDVVTTGTTIDTGKYNIKLTTTGIALNTTNGKTGGSLSDVKWALYDTTSDTAALVKQGDFTSGNLTNFQINDTAIAIPGVDEDGNPIVNTDNYTLYIWIENTEDTVAGDGTGVQDQLQGLTITAQLTVDAIQ